MKAICFIILLLSVSTGYASSEYAKEQKIVKIGTGSLLHGYYNLGIKLCRYISNSNNGIKCDVVPTSGSLENLLLLQKGEIDFAFALSNLAIDSYEGKGDFAKSGAFKGVYQLLRLHDEFFTVIVKDDDKILVFADLDGKKISNGPPKSDSSVVYDKLISHYKFKQKPSDIEITHEDYAREFCDGKVDAIMMMTGHPSALVNLISHSCVVDFVTIDNDKIQELLKDNPAFHESMLEAGRYPGITKPEKTIAVSSIFVMGPHLDKKIVENFLTYFKKKIKWFKETDPILFDLEDDHFITGFVLPAFESNIEK